MKCSAIHREKDKRGHDASSITTNVQNMSFCVNARRETSSPIVKCLIDDCLLYARPDHSQTLLQLLSYVLKISDLPSFSGKFFYQFVSSKIFKIMQIYKK